MKTKKMWAVVNWKSEIIGVFPKLKDAKECEAFLIKKYGNDCVATFKVGILNAQF